VKTVALWFAKNKIKRTIKGYGSANQKYDLKFMELSSSAKLQFLIGDIGYTFTNEFGIFYDVQTENVLDLHPCPFYIKGKSFAQRDSFYTNKMI
jgi:hypothetical protein